MAIFPDFAVIFLKFLGAKVRTAQKFPAQNRL
jgi:hypothetical protein